MFDTAERRDLAHHSGFTAEVPSTHRLPAAVALWLFALGTVAVSALALISAPPPFQFNLPFTAHLAGLLAGYFVTVMVILMARIPALESGIGADRMARWHGLLGRSLLCFIVIHGVAATLAWSAGQGIPVPRSILDVLGMPGLIAATVATALFFLIGLLSIRAARRRLRYETWHTIHLLTYLAIALSFSHELAGPDLAGFPLIQIVWSCLYTASFALLIRYRVIAPVLLLMRHRLRVERLVDEGQGVVSVILRGRHLSELNAEPGQFFRWRFLSKDSWKAAHPFSLSALPTQNYLRLTVKAVGDGTKIIHSLRPGTWVAAEGPYGAMTERRRTRHGVLLVAGGVGITPMRTLFESLRMGDAPLTLLYRASREEDILFRGELDDIARSRGAQIIYLIGPSSQPRNEITPGNLERLVPDLRHRDVYLCASPGFSEAVKRALFGAGLPRKNLHQEDFAF
ncbi:putative ferric reductase [Psychromicrobium silvestre]|uniref:Putative ferric reductase n=1 Tax=Psychromicrobium silvestre TaxID=1645614 RepID=A0A7Y9LT64_9MICC|nr:ferredoxin reductase family protein [Psychromicrobium silvestre]NYE95127.1 putative ferric reductase [Psychromicrobium silvestre]